MRVVARVAVPVLAVLATFGAVGCNRGRGGGGTTTIIQQPATSVAATSTPATPSVSPINDGAKLCSLIRGKSQSIIKAIDDFWLSPSGKTMDWSDPKVTSAADHAVQVVGKEAPIIEGAIGPSAPQDIADAARDFVKISKDFADAISRTASADELNTLNHQFTDVVNKDKDVCHF